MSSTEGKPTANDLFEARFLMFACYSLVVYDHTLTLDQEIQHLWSTRRGLSHVLFYLLRYLALCIVVIDVATIFLSGSNVTFDRRLAVASFALALAAIITLIVKMSSDTHVVNLELPGTNGCVFTLKADEFWIVYVPIIFIHTVLLCRRRNFGIPGNNWWITSGSLRNYDSYFNPVVALCAAIGSASTHVSAVRFNVTISTF
ncbi:hypothetical protein SERLA73DRAFT_69772 [Serpula lacrymans var. lacrymans S7.3]|uniref:DUF6533 domain-containing protein n=2 Tax=Serpula lacrymans var. lacrymans TaxID=341189 RepID=F8PL57_SERL3|nr:uncharacterized protein SERLADRAFT_433837 [Serpula lacrymans var. lacrymans S7.9]EGO03965.1 hypothetical protein SERLA73DRAFT_69772 [Serpula lacrymans var. lacrymans S7.3]EGO29884.1 hypothetical protein SERLADRAFT_433837 [Serpula lacrymans var. lacrymans S7.9]